MDARADILTAIRRALGATGAEAPRRRAVEDRLAQAPRGLVPARGQLDAAGHKTLFRAEAERVFATVAELPTAHDVPGEAAAYLHSHNLPLTLRMGGDPFLVTLPWEAAGLTISQGASTGDDPVGVSHAFGAVAETGTLVLVSGPANPTSLNFLPETHIVIVEAKTIVGDYETIWQKLRATYGKGLLPRTVNLITGPSRSADIEQTLLLGAHGPKNLHIIVLGDCG